MADLPTHVDELDKVKYLLQQQRVLSADVTYKNITYQLSAAQAQIQQAGQTLGALESELRGKYLLGPEDKFEPETGKIVRVPAAAEEKAKDPAQSEGNPTRTPETALPGVQGVEGQGRAHVAPKLAHIASKGPKNRPGKG